MKVSGYEHSMIYLLTFLGLLYCQYGNAGMMLAPAPERVFQFRTEATQAASHSGLSQQHFDHFQQQSLTEFDWQQPQQNMSQDLAQPAAYQDVILLKQFLGQDVERVKNEYVAIKQAMQQWVALNHSYVEIAAIDHESSAMAFEQDNILPIQGRDTEIANDSTLVYWFTQLKHGLQKPSNIVFLLLFMIAAVMVKRRLQNWRQSQVETVNEQPVRKKRRKRVRIKRA